jgi:HIRAN domain
MQQLIVAWQDHRPQSRRWYPVGKLSFDGKFYEFTYTYGAQLAREQAGFDDRQILGSSTTAFKSKDLFPCFADRLLSKTRADFPEYCKWLDFDDEAPEPIVLLGRSGGTKATDTIQVVPYPEKIAPDLYSYVFFANGIRHVPGAVERLAEITDGDCLQLVPDPGNAQDDLAIKIHDDEQSVGWVPRIINSDIKKLMDASGKEAFATVIRKNGAEVPVQYRLLCRVDLPAYSGFNAFAAPEFQTQVQQTAELA